MEMQMKSVGEVYRKMNKKTGNATQINKNGVPGPIQEQVDIGTVDFATVVRFHTKKNPNSKKFEVILGSFWSPEAIKERSDFFVFF